MEIKNGFIRDSDGEWININMIKSIFIRADGYFSSFFINVNTTNGISYQMSDLISDKEEAQKILDEAIRGIKKG